jgi:uncharacterized SAM-binding protein YcdF (DUF218 family)
MRKRGIWVLAAALVLVGLGFAVRFVVFPRTDPIGRTDLVVVLSSFGDGQKYATTDRVLAKNPNITVLFSADGGCWSRVRALAPHLVCFIPHPDTTQGEARFASAYAAAHGIRTMTVVAPRPQISRARIRFSRCWSGALQMVEAPTSALGALIQVPYQVIATVKAETYQRHC